jgi:hypothetical protein
MLTFGMVLKVIIIVIVTIVVQVGIGILAGYSRVKQTPKKPMFLCPKHGPVTKTFDFVDYEGIYQDIDGTIKSEIGDFKYCSLCYNDKLIKAERIPQ